MQHRCDCIRMHRCCDSRLILSLMVVLVTTYHLCVTREARDLPPLTPSLLEEYLSCPLPSLAKPSLARLARVANKVKVRSETLSSARQRVPALQNLPRVQIKNGSLYASCPTDEGCTSIAHDLRTLHLLLKISRVADADFFFDRAERPCYVAQRTLGPRLRSPRFRHWHSSADAHRFPSLLPSAPFTTTCRAGKQAPKPDWKLVRRWNGTALPLSMQQTATPPLPPPPPAPPPAPHGGSIAHHVYADVPIVAHETATGCDANILAPPRSLEALPDGTRWLMRAVARGRRMKQWAKARRNVAVWRGAATSRGPLVHADGRPASTRSVAAALSRRRPDLLDAKFAGRNDDLQLSDADYEHVRRQGWGASGEGFVTWQALQTYRATLALDGNTLPDRLPFLLFSMTAVLKQESPLREAWYSQLVPYVHYVPVKEDLSDLESQLSWALSNATRLHAIAQNGARLALKWLSRRSQLCHWSSLLAGLSAVTERPILLERHACRFDGGGTRWFGGKVLHNPLSSALRPQITGKKLRLADVDAVRDLTVSPCSELTGSHMCVDV